MMVPEDGGKTLKTKRIIKHQHHASTVLNHEIMRTVVKLFNTIKPPANEAHQEY